MSDDPMGKMVDAFHELCSHREPERCPCCDHLSLKARGDYEICRICWWEDDGTNDVLRGSPFSPNHCTLLEGRRNYARYGVCETRLKAGEPTLEQQRERALWLSTLTASTNGD
jgi:hypothetical protein